MNKKILTIIIVIILVVPFALWWKGFDRQKNEIVENLNFGQEVSLSGEIICLPHKESPQTLECALGLNSGGKNYALKNVPNADRSFQQVGNLVSVKGILEKPGTTTYDIVGTIDVSSLKPASLNGNASSTTTYTYAHKNPDFSFQYPRPWQIDKTPDTSWSALSSVDGTTFVSVKSPEGFMEGTNFHEARLSVGRTSDAEAYADCLVIPENHTPGTQKEMISINGIDFAKITMTDAGAGNRYETTSFRTQRGGACYSVESLIHYSPIEFYEPGSEVTEFDKVEVEKILLDMVESFDFKTEG